VGGLREIAAPFVAAAPAGVRVRTRLRVSPQDAAVLCAVGAHLGSLAGRDLAARCAEGRLSAAGAAVSRRNRKRALTAQSSSRWAGAITRASEDQWQLAERNLRAERLSLQSRVRRIANRLAVPAGQKRGHVRGYATQAERHGRQQRLQRLRARLAQVERQLDAGQAAVCRGGRRLARTRHNLEAAGMTGAQWQAEWAAVRYDISFDPAKDRWYLDASWKTPQAPAVSLEELREAPLLAVDLNYGHLAAWRVTRDGNPLGAPVTIPLELAGLPASRRDGRVRAAISELIRLARTHGCTAIAIEDLDFTEARAEGRERSGSRPSRGKRGRGFRRIVAGIPTARFRDRLAHMAYNVGLSVIAVDPAYTSRWGAEHWLAPLREQNKVTTGHHAAAVVIGRRAHGHKARRRAGVTGTDQRISRRKATPRAPHAKCATRDGRTRQAQRQLPHRRRKTVTAEQGTPPDQAAHDRSGPSDSQDYLLLSQLGTVVRYRRYRRDVSDHPAALRPHHRHNVLGGQQRGFKVHPKDFIEGVARYIDDWRVAGGQAGTDVVMQDVDTSEPVDAGSYRLRHRLFVGRVCLQGHGPAARVDDLP
jgi:hypothetical protein